MMNYYYRLGGTEVIAEPDILIWARAFETTDRRVAFTELATGITVSTVFLGVDLQYGNGPPLLFESMCFWDSNTEWDTYCERCSTYMEAEQMHERVVALITAHITSPEEHKG